MKFDLSKLGPREFENLSQALAVAEFGSTLTIFGPGPDGGREATFEGDLAVGENGPVWSGYTVLQAKYCETLTTPQKDATWLINQIRDEMNSWRTSDRRTRKPDYILFITNVSLSGVPQTGGLDRVAKELKSQCTSLGIKGWHVWHLENIGRLLEKYSTIRTSYASWVLPGDVLSEIYSHLTGRKKEVGNALQRYLAKEILRDLHVNLDQAGSADDLQIPLADVFIDLPIGPPGDHHSRETEGVLQSLVAACDRKASKSAGDPSKTRQSRFVLVGGPGQGKSTVSQFLCQLFRAKLIAETPAGRTTEVQKAITVISDHSVREGLTPRAHRWPVKIPLTHLADDLAHGRSKSILQFIASRVSDASDVSVTPQDLREWLGSFPWLVLLDGLDEVPISSNRDQVMAAVAEFLMDAEELAADVVTVATTRPQGYTDEFSPSSYSHLELKPLNKEKALHYGRKLAAARHGAQSDRTERLMNRLGQAANEASTARLMSSPLQVTIMAVLLDRMGKAPKDRYTLFKDYYRVIYERELEKEGPATNLLRDHRADIDTIHADVGLLLQARSERSGDTESRIDMGEFGSIIRRRLESEGHGGAQLEALANSISLAATDRLVFLVPSRAGEVGFEIRSLQEFWAADALMSGTDDDLRSRLRTICASAHWRNVFLFAVGKVFAERRHLRDSVIAMVSELNSYIAHEGAPTRRLLLGSRLSIYILTDGMVKSPKHESVLVDLALSLMAYPAAKELEELAPSLSQNGINVAREFVNRWLQEGRKETEALLAFLATLAGLGDPWAMQCLVGLYNSGTAEIRRKFLALGFEMGSAEMLRISAEHLLEIPISDIRLLMSGRWRRELRHSFSLPGVPDWFRRIATFVESHRMMDEQSLPSVDIGFLQLGLHVFRIGNNDLWDSMDVSDIPVDHWISRVHQFASQPSTESLAAAVTAVDEAGVDLRFDGAIFPWPVAAALQSLAAGTITREDLSNPSIVGNLKAWRDIEDSWTDRLSIENVTGEFTESISRHLPFLPYAATSGRLIGSWAAKNTSQWISTPCNILSECQNNISRAGLAQLILTVAIHGPVRDKATRSEASHLQRLTEYALACEGTADLGWLSRLKSFDNEVVLWLDQIGREAVGRIWLFHVPPAAFRAWVADFSLTGLGALLCSADLATLNRTAQAKIRREWKAVRSGNGADVRRRALAGLAVSSFARCADMDDWSDRLSALTEGVRDGVFNADSVVSQIHLSHDPLQQKLLLTFLDSLDDFGATSYNTWEAAYERLVSDQFSVLTNIDFTSARI
ncbi:NACHT domain-containing protein [Kitasatospora sp. NPDC127067]|uniref:NACHT domain-containing protein n=1 Tax=Kitasatospora sp. NPDC127067 TaxID=3347126 RepID=UPI0036691507